MRDKLGRVTIEEGNLHDSVQILQNHKESNDQKEKKESQFHSILKEDLNSSKISAKPSPQEPSTDK